MQNTPVPHGIDEDVKNTLTYALASSAHFE